jgi:DNA-binding CsgD family transcriptional regulator
MNLYKNNNVANIKAIRKKNLPYVLLWVVYYAWVVAFTTWWTASPITEKVFDSGFRSLLHSVNLISSALFVFIIQKEWFVKTARLGALLIILSMSLYLTAPSTRIHLFSVITIGITLGIVNISILIPFVFAMNNTEKLYSVVGSNILISLILLVQHGYSSNRQQGIKEHIITFLVLTIALSATLFFKKSSLIPLSQADINIPEMKPRIYITLVLNCAVAILCKGVGKGVLNITAGIYGNQVHQWYYIGGLVGCLTFVSIYAFSKKAFIWIGNISFSSIAMGLLCNAFMGEVPGLAIAFAVFLGIGSTMGMINMYYIIAVVGKKYNNMRYLRLSIFFIGICGGISGIVVGNLIHSINTSEITMIASIVSVAFMMIFMMLSPLLSQTQYYNDWAKDSEKIEIDNEQLDMFKKFQLSRREIEVCKLLLEGYTLRQVSAMLSIAYSTVNTYCTSAYRKLEINSRTELLILFKDYDIK